MKIRNLFGWTAAAALALYISGCGGTAVNPNLPAIQTQPTNQTVTVGSTATFTVTATGQAPLSYQWYVFATPIKGATSVSYTTPITAPSDNGSFYFVVISNALGSIESSEVTLTVNTPPLINSPATATLLEGLSGSFTITTTASPVATVAVTGALPTGISFTAGASSGTGILSGTPTVAGKFPLTVTASNGINPSATQNFTLTISTQAPAITSVNSATFAESQADTFTVTTTGAPPPSLAETGVLPTGVTFVDNGNGTATLSGTPTESGVFQFTFTAKNGINPNAVQTFFLTVPAAGSPGVVRANGGDVTTFRNDAGRTGQNLNETILNPTNVSSATFGKVGFFPVNGTTDAEPLYASNVAIPGRDSANVLYVATESDTVTAFNADTGAVIWQESLLSPSEGPADNSACNPASPHVGISATPVIDRSRGANGAIYVIAASADANGTSVQRIHALDLATGAELPQSPSVIQASASSVGTTSSGGSASPFDPSDAFSQSGLELLNGKVYALFAPGCGSVVQSGWLFEFDGGTLQPTSTLNLPSSGSAQESWAASDLSADAAGNLYLFNSNGSLSDLLKPTSFANQIPFGNSFLKISGAGALSIAGYSGVSVSASSSDSNAMLGLGGVLVLPDVTNSLGATLHLAVGADASANIYVLNRDALNSSGLSASAVTDTVSGAFASQGAVSTPAYFNQTLYFSASDDAIKAFSLVNGELSTSAVNQTPSIFGPAAASPVISANAASGAILWAVDSTPAGAVLHAYDATNLAQELYNSDQAASGRDSVGLAANSVTPVVANGKVYVATQNGIVVFGLLQ